MASSSCIFPSNVLGFLEVVGKLKTTKRAGWVRNNIPQPESIADHMYRMSMMALMITDSRVDKDKLMKMCMVHDLAESLIGDFTPHCKITKDEKRRMEEEAMRSITANIGDNPVSREILSLWLEYEDCASIEAEIAHQLDKLEMIIQADEYEQASIEQAAASNPQKSMPTGVTPIDFLEPHSSSTAHKADNSNISADTSAAVDLEEFFTSTSDCFLHPEVSSWANELRRRRAQRKNSQNHGCA